eukprot:TRINITY_DN5378_c0_g1_i5.p1 TRINITY_DN5378_c0_g1~~TRINITY_DN5378_c0_g1_i5.p1  ORF type:complete len:324 (-),score=75.01 TRINITY_DN5378_c0_g1_i5:114-1085(-)
MANRVNGKGFENTENYRNAKIEFLDIENIHHIRDAHAKLLTLSYNPDNNNNFYTQLDSSKWLQIMSLLLTGANKIVRSVKEGISVLIHCSDGWDRTSQLSALAQLLIDPYYRTIEGFKVLVEKEFVAFGHQFTLRCAHINKLLGDKERAPIFLQFLDAVFQVYQQQPAEFEFNSEFLAAIAYHAYDCRFGTFLTNSEQDKLLFKLQEETVSLWSFIESKRESYLNIFYTPDENRKEALYVSAQIRNLKLWEEWYLKHWPSLKRLWGINEPEVNRNFTVKFISMLKEELLAKDERIKELEALLNNTPKEIVEEETKEQELPSDS